MSDISKELRNALKGDVSALDIPDIRKLATALKRELQVQIQGADMPEGVKNALLNSISISVMPPDRAIISIKTMRPSIYSSLGWGGDADLALVYDQRKQIKSSAVYYNKNDGVFIPIGKIPGFARSYANNYLSKTANAFMAKHPECIVTVSK